MAEGIRPRFALPGKAWYFGGDFHLGRHLGSLGSDPAATAFFEERILRHTGGKPLVVNLEGVLTNTPPDPASLDSMQIVMPADPTIALMKRLKIAGVVLANNHTLDLGEDARAAMVARCARKKFVVIEEGAEAAFPEFSLFAASDVRKPPRPRGERAQGGRFSPNGGGHETLPAALRVSPLGGGIPRRTGRSPALDRADGEGGGV